MQMPTNAEKRVYNGKEEKTVGFQRSPAVFLGEFRYITIFRTWGCFLTDAGTHISVPTLDHRGMESQRWR